MKAHLKTAEHARLLEHRDDLALKKKSLQFEAEAEAAHLRELNPILSPAPTPNIVRPPIEVDSDSDIILDDLDDIFFSAEDDRLRHKDTDLAITQEEWPDDSGIASANYLDNDLDDSLAKSTALKDVLEGEYIIICGKLAA